ncbi:MAG: AraC family transcriptional regulator [Bacteroidota bacterium]
MLRTQFPDLAHLHARIERGRRNGEGWPTCILNVKTQTVYRPEVKGPLSLFINRRGTSHCRVGSHRATIDDQHYFLTNAGDEYDLTIESEQPVETFNIHISESLATDVFAGLMLTDGALLDQPDRTLATAPGFFSQLYRRDSAVDGLIEEITATHPFGTDPLLEAEQMSRLLRHLSQIHRGALREADRISAARPATRQETYRRLTIARDYLHSSLGQEVQLEEVARVACMSRYHFLRAFRETFRCTPYQYLKQLRMDRARQLLHTSHLSVQEIGFSLGYQNLSSFSRVFRQVEGMGPRRFRELRHAVV